LLSRFTIRRGQAQGQHDARDGWTEEPPAVEGHRVEGEGVPDHGGILDQGADQALPQRGVDAVQDAEQAGHGHHHRRRDNAGQGQNAQCGAMQHQQALNADQQAAPVDPVEDGPHQRGDDHLRRHGEERGETQQFGGAGQPVDQPTHGDLLHPGPQDGHQLAEEIEPKGPVSQGLRALGPTPPSP